MNINEIISSIEELTIRITALEKSATALKSVVESLAQRVSALENKTE